MPVNLLPFPKIPPVQGVKLSAINFHAKDKWSIIALAPSTNVSCIFTQNALAAAPIIVAKQHLSQIKPSYLLINAGNANAAGTAGKAEMVVDANTNALNDVLTGVVTSGTASGDTSPPPSINPKFHLPPPSINPKFHLPPSTNANDNGGTATPGAGIVEAASPGAAKA